MNYLVENGISKETVEGIKKTYSENTLDSLEFNEENVIKVIDFLKESGITIDNIEKIFFININVFFKSVDDLKNNFNKYEKDKLAVVLNDNIDLINDLLV
ncbi:MAG: hypothetical protein IKF36_00500 [Bacilli bacterium]|nr:hypothetical protein [Bacilli bacterium]